MNKKLLFLLPVFFCFIFQGCLKDKFLETYTVLTPIYKEKSEVYANIKSNQPVKIIKPGKLFVYGNYIFLNEIDKGVHIIDNSNPANPVTKAFIDIPGNLDIAVKGNTLYADLYSDLVVVDITDPLQARFIKYIPGKFPERNYTNGFVADSNRIIVGWNSKDTTVRINNLCNRCDVIMQLSSYSPVQGGGIGASAGPVGVSGSMARFTIMNNYLYTVNRSALTSFNISNTNSPVQTATQNIGWNIETIYPFESKLFIGSQTGMFIYSVSNPATPVKLGQFTHAMSCDPVIADGNYAYVTLRSGTNCARAVNVLDIINITNVLSPVLVKSYTMTNPHGLSKVNNTLFLCDGEAGLKMYDVTNPMNITLQNSVTNINAYDVIAYNGLLLVAAKDGLYQYEYSFPDKINLKSKITVNQ